MKSISNKFGIIVTLLAVIFLLVAYYTYSYSGINIHKADGYFFIATLIFTFLFPILLGIQYKVWGFAIGSVVAGLLVLINFYLLMGSGYCSDSCGIIGAILGFINGLLLLFGLIAGIVGWVKIRKS
jgi:hypothetical protein